MTVYILGDIRIAHVRIVLEHAHKADGMKSGTVKHIRGVMRRVMQSAVEAELIAENVVAKIRVPKIREVKKRRVILTDADILQFFACDDIGIEIRVLVSRRVARAGCGRAASPPGCTR